MSLSTRITDVLTRIGLEFKSVRSAIALKYTKPVTGIPLDDLSTAVTDAFTQTWGNLEGKPSTFPPSTHSHTMTQVTGLNAALNSKVTAASGSLTIWTGTVANLPTTRDAYTVYLAW